MRVAYIDYNEIDSLKANINQILNMVSSLSNYTKVTLFTNYVRSKKFNQNLNFFSVKNNFEIKRMHSIYIDFNKYLEFLFRILYYINVLFLLKTSKFDIIYTRDMGFLLFIKYFSLIKPKQKIIYEIHTIFHLTSTKVSFNQEKSALSAADFYIVISNGVKKDLINIFDIPRKKIEVLPDGVNLNLYNQINVKSDYLKKYGVSKEKKIIVYTGSFLEWKGTDTFIQSIRHIRSDSVIFLLVGARKEDREKISNLISKNKLDKQKILVLEFMPSQEVIKILKSSNIAIIPNKKFKISEEYTSPLKLFEYLACGLPIIASNLPSMREIIKENKNGLFFKSENENDLANKIDYLINRPSLMKTMAINNLKIVKSYSWDNRARDIINIVEKIK